jgi:thioester reductase-like protein
MTNLLLTGGTGFLGCNILYQLLVQTHYNVFVIVRGHTIQESISKIKHKYMLYFKESLDAMIGKRLFIINADIEKSNFGMEKQDYQALASKVDSVIHSAALVKHYGDETIFYSANVLATIHLLEFSQKARKPFFHYISTASVLSVGPETTGIPLYTEDDLPHTLPIPNNVYVKTKLQAECKVIEYRRHGIKSNIYRVGNLAFMLRGCQLQENKEDNAFLNWMKCLLHMRCFTREMDHFELSPVDMTAKAIVRIFDKADLQNQIYHILNPKKISLEKLISNDTHFKINLVSMNEFIRRILNNLNSLQFHQLTLKLLLRQGWLDGKNMQNFNGSCVLQSRTDQVLEKLGFLWPPITQEVFKHYLKEITA